MTTRTPRRALTALALTVAIAALTGCSSETKNDRPAPAPASSSSTATGGFELRTTQEMWDRPEDQDAAVKAAGLVLAPEETTTVHYHAHLDVLVDGEPFPVPAGLGINAGPNGELPEHGAPGIAALHTHDTSGVLHIEAPSDATFTLGQVFTEWGVKLTAGQIGGYTGHGAQQVGVYVNGKPYTGDPATIVLKAHEEIAVVVGDAAQQKQAPSKFDFPEGE